MGQREQQEVLDELRKKGTPIYSFSKIETINNCLYEAYRTYIMHDRDNQEQNIYACLGTKIHDCLEEIMNGTKSEDDLLTAMNQELDDMDMLGIEFPKGKDGSNLIRDGWISDMTHFCNTYKAPKGKFETEQFFLFKTPNNNYFQGYIDLTKINNDGTISIYDYKTSSMYRGEDIKKHGRQLVLYAMGKEQEGYKVKEIAWIMLKYCEVFYTGKKTARSKEEVELSKVIERKNLIKELKNIIEAKLIKLGMDEIDIEIELMNAIDNNKIPECIADQFTIKPYVMKYELNDENRQDLINYFDSTIEMWENLGKIEKNYPHRDFEKTQKNGKVVQDVFFCTSLCGYKKLCPHIKEYFDTKEEHNEYEELF